MLSLIFPNSSHQDAYLEMISEWKDFETIPTSPSNLFQGDNFEEFLALVTRDRDNPEEGLVPATLFFLLDGTRILGAIHVRHHIDHPFLAETGGHIGYGIRPSERRKGYATAMLALALVEARLLGLERVLLGCHDDNIASQKTIESNGGVFDRYTEHEGKKSRRYWIEL